MNTLSKCLTVGFIASLTVTLSYADPIVQFDFNDTDGNTSSNSTVGTATGILISTAVYSSTTAAPVNSTGSKSLWVPNGVNSSDASFRSDAVFSNLTSFTLSGWIKLSGTGGRVMSTGGGAAEGGFDLYLNSSKLQLRVDGTDATATGDTSLGTNWVYFAVTYDGTLTGANVQYYIGDGTNLTADGLTTINKAAVDNSSYALEIGNHPFLNRNMQGYLDNIRVYGGTSTNGIASVALLTEAMQYDDVPPPPLGTVIVVQ